MNEFQQQIEEIVRVAVPDLTPNQLTRISVGVYGVTEIEISNRLGEIHSRIMVAALVLPTLILKGGRSGPPQYVKDSLDYADHMVKMASTKPRQ